MKKFLLCFCFLLSTPSFALNCEAGTRINGLNGASYCLSDLSMNWWSASTWCQAQGGKLISLDDCVYDGQDYLSTGKCNNLALGLTSGHVWTSVLSSSNSISFTINLSTGKVDTGYYLLNYMNKALCK